MKSLIWRTFRFWFPLAIVITLFCGLIYAVIQQDLRHGADDPQIQLAEDTAAALTGGAQAQSITGGTKVDLSTSLAPYVIIFNDGGQPVASSALLNGKIPTPPEGVFTQVKEHGEDRFTWQPQAGVRSAVTVTRVGGANPGYVLAGRSLRVVENREDDFKTIIGLGWLVILLILFFVIAIISWLDERLNLVN